MAQAQVTNRNVGIAVLGSDEAGSSAVQMIILAAVLALGSLVAVRTLGGSVGAKFDCTGDAIAGMTAGAPCRDSGGGPAGSLPVATIPGAAPAPGAAPVGLPTETPSPTPSPGTTPAPGSTPSISGQPGPTPNPQPGPSVEPPPPEPQGQFTPENEEEVKRLIAEALARHNGDISLAFADLRDQRQKPEGFFDTNLAIAADYLRARLETQNLGPVVAADEVEAYILLKKTVGVPKEGPGPVSPFSELQAKYMRQGVIDEANQMSVGEILFWSSPPGVALGTAKAAFGLLRGDL